MSLALQRTAMRARAGSAQALARSLRAIMGDVRLLWIPTAADTLAVADISGYGHTITHSATQIGRTTALGGIGGVGVAFATSEYATITDAASLSFGNSTTDSPLSLVALVNVTNTAAARTIIAKYSFVTAHEWIWEVEPTDVITLYILDQSVSGASPFRRSDAAVTQGAWTLLGATYAPSTGATAADGITLYSNGASVASTATNNASYVAMENRTLDVSIGARNLTGTPFGHFTGSMALVAVCAKALSAADHAAIAALCRAYFGVTL